MQSLLPSFTVPLTHTEESESGSGSSSEGYVSDHKAFEAPQAFGRLGSDGTVVQPETLGHTHSGHGHAPKFPTDMSGECVS